MYTFIHYIIICIAYESVYIAILILGICITMEGVKMYENLNKPFRPVKSMAEEVRALGYEVIEIGDGAKVGNVMTSIWSAFDAEKTEDEIKVCSQLKELPGNPIVQVSGVLTCDRR